MAVTKKDPVWLRIIVALVLHLLWFVTGFVGTLFFLFQSYPTPEDGWVYSIYGCALAVGAVGGIFGPATFNRERLLGRGVLDEVKKQSRPPKPKG